jgi:AcrR family transcriptional regulator
MPAMKKPRQTKSDRTCAAIADAAGRLFAANGYDRTTVRDIAAAADIDPALVIRYFGSKDQLFAEVATFDLKLPDLAGIPPERRGEALVRHYVSVWEGETGTEGLPILLRSAASNDLAAEQMREIFRAQVLPVIARVTGDAKAPGVAALIASQLLGMGLCRYILKFPPLVAMPRETLIAEIGRAIQGYLAMTMGDHRPNARRIQR